MRRMGIPKHSLPECTAKLHTKNCTYKYLMQKMQNKMHISYNALIISMLRSCENFPYADAQFHGMKLPLSWHETPTFMP